MFGVIWSRSKTPQSTIGNLDLTVDPTKLASLTTGTLFHKGTSNGLCYYSGTVGTFENYALVPDDFAFQRD